MELLLVFLLGTVVLGLVTDRLDRRTYGVILAAAVLVASLFFVSIRFWV